MFFGEFGLAGVFFLCGAKRRGPGAAFEWLKSRESQLKSGKAIGKRHTMMAV